jgi:methionyl-tRNA synthetase
MAALPFYVTTPIYYVNDVPHLGTAYTTIVADALRRYHLLRGEDTRMLTGTDEHGLKLERAAKEQGISTREFVDKMSGRFREAWPKLHIASDDFIRTTEPRHIERAQDLWKKIEARGDLYEAAYEDWYCVGCESFKTEKELLPGNECPLHPGKPIDRVKEETYFFRLSRWQQPLLDFYARHPKFIEPLSRRNEVISFVESGLRDLSVSRTSFSWGVPVPGNPKHVMYVWFDALTNYLSALGADDGDLRRFWPPRGRAVHLVGKDILRFHTVYWPAFLLAAGYREDQLPTQVFAHGFLTVDGQKMSKALRNGVNPVRLAEELGADVVRYQLLRAIAFGHDGDFDHAAMIERHNADLGKNIGNLLSRTLGLCAKNTGGRTPNAGAKIIDLDNELATRAASLFEAAQEAWEEIAPHRALELTCELSSLANQYVERSAPWTAAKNGDTARIETILGTLLAVVGALSVMIWPALPTKSDEMRAQLGLPPIAPGVGSDLWPKALPFRAAGEALPGGAPLFQVIDKDRERELLDRLVPKPAAETEATQAASRATPVAVAPPAAPSGRETTQLISYDDFAKTELRVGLVSHAERVPRKDKLLKLTVDIGENEPRTIIAGLALSFKPEELLNRRVIVVANLAPRDFGKGLVSFGMLLATGPSDALKLATVDGDAKPGDSLK